MTFYGYGGEKSGVTSAEREEHAELGYFTPIEVEMEYVHQQGLLRQAA
jgi:hypothetical protein